MAFPNCSHVSATDTSRPTGADYIYCLAKEVRKLKESIAAGNGVFDVLAANVIEPLPTTTNGPVVNTFTIGDSFGNQHVIGGAANSNVFVYPQIRTDLDVVHVGDGVTFETKILGGVGRWTAAGASGEDICIAAGSPLEYSISTDDGQTWSAKSTDMPAVAGAPLGMAGSGTAFVVGLYNGSVCLRKPNVGAWASIALGLETTWRPVKYGDGKFIITSGHPGYIAISSDDGLTFSTPDIAIDYTEGGFDLSYIAWNGTVWASFGHGVVITSSTAEPGTWSVVGTTPFSSANSIAALNGVLYTCDAFFNNKLAYSVDNGVTWDVLTLPSYGIFSVLSNGTKLVAYANLHLSIVCCTVV